MKLLEEINSKVSDLNINNLDSIETNEGLELLIESIRKTLMNDGFETTEEIDAYYKAAILIFNNLKKPYWRERKAEITKYDNYFREKMQISLANGKDGAINQLYKRWTDKDIKNIEYNLRGLQLIFKEHNIEFDKDIIKLIIKVLYPLINRAEQKLIKYDEEMMD
mgnify:CR=1 FL=1